MIDLPTLLRLANNPADMPGCGPLAAEKLQRVLTNDPGMGVIRHVDAGYQHAIDVAAQRGVRIPMQEQS